MGTANAKQLIEACERGQLSPASLREELCRRVESGQLDVPGIGQMSTAGAVEAFIESSQRAARARQGSSFRGLLDFVSEVSSGISQGFSRWLEGPGPQPATATTATAPTTTTATTEENKVQAQAQELDGEATQVMDIGDQLIELSDIAQVQAPELDHQATSEPVEAAIPQSEPGSAGARTPDQLTQLELLADFDEGELSETEFIRLVHARIDAKPDSREFKPYELSAIGLPPDYARMRLSAIDLVELLRARKTRRAQIQEELAAGRNSRAEEARRAALRRYQRGSCNLEALRACLDPWGTELRPLEADELEQATQLRQATARRRRALIDFRRLLTHYECATVHSVTQGGDSAALADQLIGQLSCSHIDATQDQDLHRELISLWRLLASGSPSEKPSAGARSPLETQLEQTAALSSRVQPTLQANH